MKIKTLLAASLPLFLLHFSGKTQTVKHDIVQKAYIERVLNTLASDEMNGRHAFSADADKAADFIASEFKEIGLHPFNEPSFKQSFQIQRVLKKSSSVIWGGENLDQTRYLILGNEKFTHWTASSQIPIYNIQKEDDFANTFRKFAQSNEDAIILVDPNYSSFIARFNTIYNRENIVSSSIKHPTKVFIIADQLEKNYQIVQENNVENIPLSNVVGCLPGLSKPSEYVIFSCHYDHIGVLKPIDSDSIANGADDDASGTTAMISLAKYYQKQRNNERTLLFVAFTAEEVGMYGSKYFSNAIQADSVIAMINIEMIGKDAKFGPNSLYITGYDKSNLGKLMKQNLKGSAFRFHPDPYPQQNLFYRSDNAVLAAKGVPAHTFSTSQIDKDEYYHTVKDEVSTLNIDNIKSSIEAIAMGASGIVSGKQTPTRVEKLHD